MSRGRVSGTMPDEQEASIMGDGRRCEFAVSSEFRNLFWAGGRSHDELCPPFRGIGLRFHTLDAARAAAWAEARAAKIDICPQTGNVMREVFTVTAWRLGDGGEWEQVGLDLMPSGSPRSERVDPISLHPGLHPATCGLGEDWQAGAELCRRLEEAFGRDWRGLPWVRVLDLGAEEPPEREFDPGAPVS